MSKGTHQPCSICLIAAVGHYHSSFPLETSGVTMDLRPPSHVISAGMLTKDIRGPMTKDIKETHTMTKDIRVEEAVIQNGAAQ